MSTVGSHQLPVGLMNMGVELSISPDQFVSVPEGSTILLWNCISLPLISLNNVVTITYSTPAVRSHSMREP